MKHIKQILLSAFIGTVFSCNFYVDSKKPLSSMQDAMEKPQDQELIGTWAIDSFSYRFLEKHYEIGDQKVLLNINQDGSMHFKNLPDLNSIDGKKVDKNNVYHLSGRWELFQYKEGGRWLLRRKNFSKNLGLATTLNLFYKDKDLVIVSYIGDPDLGNRLLFLKVE